MKRTYQIINIPSVSEDLVRISARCRSDFKRVAGIFFSSPLDISDIRSTCRLTINSKEILPHESEVELFLATDYCSRKEVMLDLSSDYIEAENSAVDIELKYNSSVHPDFKLYLLLEND